MKEKAKRNLYVKGFLKGFSKGGILGLLFYKNWIIFMIFGFLIGVLHCFTEKKRVWEEEKREVTYQFKEGLQGISTALSAGYSIENSFHQAKKDLILLYGPDAVLVREFGQIEKELALNIPVETVLYEFAGRFDTEDILHFAQVFQTAKRTGGNLIAITHSTAEKIGQKIEVQREIQTMIAGKKMEGKIMNMIPLFMILYFWICSPGFLDCLYQGSGRMVSTILMLGYIAAYLWSGKLSEIRV